MFAKLFTGSLFILCLLFYWLQGEYNQALTTPIIFEQPKVVEIKKGDTFKQISNKLLEQKITINPYWFKFIAYQKKITDKLKAGEYNLKSGLTMPEILALFVKGKSRQYSITFPEGWAFKKILQEIQNNPNIQITLENVNFKDIMGKMKSKNNHPEGLFYPDTYFFDKNTSDLSLLKRAYDKMQIILKKEWKGRAENLPLKTPYQALILASIIEKETGTANERPEISGVFTRRLKKGMRLQTDPTVIYGMGDSYKGNIRRKDLRKPTPYNTYTMKGLPPTPIAMPGKAAIHAALHPNKGDTLYFVAKGDGKGTHYFSSSLKEHNNAVNKYQRNR